MSIRTDMAYELHEIKNQNGIIDGIIYREIIKNGFKITEIIIDEKGTKEIGKPEGKYITIETGKIWNYDKETFDKAALTISLFLNELLFAKKTENDCVLVAGLGNESITPDSIGPKLMKKIVVTRHIEKLNIELYKSIGFGSIAAIAPGVLGQTGIESAEIIKSVADAIKPCAVIVVDALASRRLERLATTVQISDTGISPGSGVLNSRAEISEKTLGVPVISVGIPTVVDAATLAYDLIMEVTGIDDNEVFEKINEKIFLGRGKNLFVAPKESDIITDSAARLIGTAINMCIHKNVHIEELSEYLP